MCTSADCSVHHTDTPKSNVHCVVWAGSWVDGGWSEWTLLTGLWTVVCVRAPASRTCTRFFIATPLAARWQNSGRKKGKLRALRFGFWFERFKRLSLREIYNIKPYVQLHSGHRGTRTIRFSIHTAHWSGERSRLSSTSCTTGTVLLGMGGEERAGSITGTATPGL